MELFAPIYTAYFLLKVLPGHCFKIVEVLHESAFDTGVPYLGFVAEDSWNSEPSEQDVLLRTSSIKHNYPDRERMQTRRIFQVIRHCFWL